MSFKKEMLVFASKRKSFARILALVLFIFVLPLLLLHGQKQKLIPEAAAAAPLYQASPACTPPTQMASTPEQTAWQLFVAATCPVNAGKYPYVVWENWIEQSDLYQQSGLAVQAQRTHRLHGSPLAQARASSTAHGSLTAGLPQVANQNCTVSAITGRTICEEVRINPDAQTYITQTAGGLQLRNNQAQLAASGGSINFPMPAVEIKADWIKLDSCSNPPQGVHVENISGVCYALAGMHLISKLWPTWVWATFEALNLTTNPQRCVALGCNDPWGSNPAYSQGGPNGNTELSADLQSLMKSANLAPEWFNYRLDGVQMTFNNTGNNQIATATLLGNSIIEGENAGVPMEQASCITCHSVSSVASNGADGIGFLAASTFNPVGSAVAPPASSGSCQWITRDFVWSLLLAPPSAPSGCTATNTMSARRRK